MCQWGSVLLSLRVIVSCISHWKTCADVAHPLLMAGKSTMPAMFDGKYACQSGASCAKTRPISLGPTPKWPKCPNLSEIKKLSGIIMATEIC